MRYLVTGGAGFLGINLARFLLLKGHFVRTLDFAEFDYLEREQVDVVDGDIRDKGTVTKALEGIDIVVHAAAALPLYSEEDIYSTDVEGTRNVLELSMKKGVKRVIHISSTAVYGIPDHHPLREDDLLKGVGAYGEAKIKAEKICEEFRSKGMCVPLLRPKSFIGPERLGVFALLFDWAKSGRSFPVLGNGENRYQFLDVEDLCQAIYLCAIMAEEKVNDTFNIGAKEFATLREDFQSVLDYAGFNKKIKTVPAIPVILMLRGLELLKLSPLYKWVYETVCHDSFVSIEKAEGVLGFKPKYSNQEALIRNYQWYVDNHTAYEKKTGISHRTPWKQGILSIIKFLF